MVKKSSVNIGIIGLGHWGRNILRNLYEIGALHTACDSSPEVIKERKKEFPKINYTPYFEDILKDPSIGGVIIATPATTHHEIVKEALSAGKHVLVEKPLSLTVAKGKELVSLAKRKKKTLMVGHILQYHPAVIKLKSMISNGDLGKIRYIYSNRLNIGKLRTEENILWSFAPHDISVILMLMDEEPVKVDCFGGDYLSEGICDVTLSTLEFSNAVKAHIFVSWIHPYKEQKLVVVGSKAMAVFDDLTKEKLFIYPHKIEWKNGKIPVAYKCTPQHIDVENKEPLREEIVHFIECIINRKTPRTGPEEGIRVLKVLEEAEKSLQKKQFISDNKLANTNPDQLSDRRRFFVHPSSYVDEKVEIGDGTKIWCFSHILKNTKIGKDCIIGQNVMIGSDASVGNRCKIQNNVSVYKGVVLEDDVFCGPSCVFTNVYNPRAFIERKHEFLPTLVRKGATIGANATIVCGITIGRYAFIGAGAVVKEDVPDNALVVGVPAKQIGHVCKCGVTLKLVHNRAKCSYCNTGYIKSGNKVKEN